MTTQNNVAVFFRTYGCQANVADSAGLAQYLEGLGCSMAQSESDADLIIVNTCAIREKAEQKLYSYLGELIDYKANKPYLRVGVIGCVASYRKKEMLKRFDHVSFVSGARDERGSFLAYLADVIVQLQTAKQLFVDSGTYRTAGQTRNINQFVAARKLIIPKNLPEASTQAALGGTVAHKQEAKKAYVNITTGCNNYCTYCIVPFTRGRETSYSIDDIVTRVTHDVANGAQEINLIGQNVNSYQCPQTGNRFAALLEAVALIPGQFWVRYVSPHPKDMTVDVLETMAKYSDKLCTWSHFPLQAGSTRVLDLMNRTYTKEEFIEQANRIKAIVPDVTISTDIIVGFPGETHEEYLETREVMEEVKFDFVFSFIYSRRKYTKAFAMGDPIPMKEKQSRLQALQKRQIEICVERNQRHIGKQLVVLVEKVFDNGTLLARNSGNIRVFMNGDASLVGTFCIVTVTAAHAAQVEAEYQAPYSITNYSLSSVQIGQNNNSSSIV